MEIYKDKENRKIFKGGDSTIENNISQIVFESSMKKICIYHSYLIVLTNEKIARNIYCLSQDLNLLWQIEGSKYDIHSEENSKTLNSYYTDINLENNIITARNYSDFEVVINVDNGRIIKEKIVR